MEWLYLNPALKHQQWDLQRLEVQSVIRMCPAYNSARWKRKRNFERLPLSLGFIKSLYALVQLAVPAKSCKSCCVPDHKLGWDGSAVWWGLHNTHAAYIWLKALLLIPHFYEHKINFLFFLLLWRTRPVARHKQESLSRQAKIPRGVMQWSKIISDMIVHFPITQCLTPLENEMSPGLNVPAVI